MSAGVEQGVFAADMPVRMPVDEAAPIGSDWAGPYVGFALGGQWTTRIGRPRNSLTHPH
jgi:hypothetical protein